MKSPALGPTGHTRQSWQMCWVSCLLTPSSREVGTRAAPTSPLPTSSHPQVRAGEASLDVRTLTVSLQGLELCRVVAVHVENLLSAREKRLTLPPSEITLL